MLFYGNTLVIFTDRINDIYINNDHDTFFKRFDINDKPPLVCSLVMMYYFFTTLSTVGFGDYYPVGNLERIVTIPILIFGVMVFSYIMGNFSGIL